MKGILTKLEFKAILYLKGLDKHQIIDIIRMQDYFCITYKRDKFFTTDTIQISEVSNCVQNHFKTLLH